MMKLVIFTLSIIFFYEQFNSVFAGSSMMFTKYTLLDSATCSTNEAAFITKPVKTGLVCAVLCDASPSCFGAQYNLQTQECIGCAILYAIDSATHLNGTVFYGRKAYTLTEEEMKWHDAKENCVTLGGRLAVIKTLHEKMFVDKVLEKAGIEMPSRVWIGASDLGTEGSYVWEEDGSSLSETQTGTFLKWGKDQPNNYNNQDCINLYRNAFEWRLNDEDCTDKHLSVCELS